MTPQVLSVSEEEHNCLLTKLKVVSSTFSFEVHAPKYQRTDELGLHLPLEVHEDGGQVSVRVVGDAGGGDGLQELGLRELPS